MVTSMVPHLQPIVRPKESIQLDYEAEMVAIVGKRAKHLSMANATILRNFLRFFSAWSRPWFRTCSQLCVQKNRSNSTMKPRWSQSWASAPSISAWPTRQYYEISLDFFPHGHVHGSAPAANCASKRIDPTRL